MDLLLPFPPSVNHYWDYKVRRKGLKMWVQCNLSKRAILFRKEALIMIKQQFPVHNVIDYPVRVTLYLHPKTKGRYDVDNFSKGLLDAITHANIWLDDELVYDLRCIKRYTTKMGAVVASIEPLDNDDLPDKLAA